MATPSPLPSDFAFSAISVLASSISSRTRSDAFVETSLTTSPSDLSAVPFSLLLIVATPEPLQKLREYEAADQGRDDRNLRATRVACRCLMCVPGRLRLAVCGCC